VQQALDANLPIVALESTIISHGMPWPQNAITAKLVEDEVRKNGAVPATIAIRDGKCLVGLREEDIDYLGQTPGVWKVSLRDMPYVIAKKLPGATTVAATMRIASMAGIKIFATGGIGGVHRGANESFDESADLTALSTLDITVVCAGVKSILDVGATLERLETLAIGLVGYKTTAFPGFYLTDSGFTIEHRVESAADIAAVIKARESVGTNGAALLVANPVAKEMNRAKHDLILASGLAKAEAAHIIGKDVTPFLLEHFHTTSEGESLSVNIEIIKSNSALAADIAVACK
jgi:pseudouridine-5'-phosphate glycosidase